MTLTAPEHPVLDPTPISDQIDAILGKAKKKDLDRVTASTQIAALLHGYADEIEAAGGGEDGDPDMWEWSERVRWAAIPDGHESMSMRSYLAEFGDVLVPLWEDPRMDEEDGSGE